MLRNAPNLNYLFAGLAVEELIRNGVEWFVVCPGSRSAPLALAIASHPRAKTVVHHDERGAAFHALGLAKGSGKPAVFVCTSGSAVANALPAVVEASYGGVPMILLTADRPPHLQGTGANQTIDQVGIYGCFVRWEHNFIVDADHFRAEDVLTTVDRGYGHATAAWPGPVHLNCMMDEPLAPEALVSGTPDCAALLKPIEYWLGSAAPYDAPEKARTSIDEGIEAAALHKISGASHGLMILGQLSPVDTDVVSEIAGRLQWPVIPDITTSGFRLSAVMPRCSHYGIYSIDTLIGATDVLIHLGGPITSRRMLDAVSRFRRDYIRVSPSPGGLDPYRNVTLRLVADPAFFCRMLDKAPTNPASLAWLREAFKPESVVPGALKDAFRDNDPVSEPGVAYRVSYPQISSRTIFLGNSMPIRDMDLFGHAGDGWTRVEANRGVSGIDGNIATAAGIARSTEAIMTVVIGDLAALHDLNSLALVRDLKTPFVVVVLNNDGGGIFSLLPIAKYADHFERFFGTPHGLQFEHAAAMYGLSYQRPATNGEFSTMHEGLLGTNGPGLIEVRTNREENARTHRALDAKIRAELDKLGA